jgi:hypothetical protein
MGECQLCLGTRSSAPERRAGGRVNGLAEMLSQRLLPLAANRDYRPSAVIGTRKLVALKPPVVGCTVPPARHAWCGALH